MLEPLCPHFNAAVVGVTARLFPTGFDTGPDAPNTFEDLMAHIERTGRMLVWDGASDRTIFGSPEVNHAFRAWHDWAHWRFRLPFTPEGERAACAVQQDHMRRLYGDNALSRWFCALLEAEIIGQIEYHTAHGDFPVDQRAFVVDWLGRRGLVSPFGKRLKVAA